MKHSYVYKLVEKTTGRYYIGYRTCIATRSPLEDIGTFYYSSGTFKDSFKSNPSAYDIEIIQVFDNKKVAYLFEQSMIQCNIKIPNCVNRNVDYQVLTGKSKVEISPEFDQTLVNMSRSQRRRKRLVESKRLKKIKQYDKLKKHYTHYTDIETGNLVTIIP